MMQAIEGEMREKQELENKIKAMESKVLQVRAASCGGMALQPRLAAPPLASRTRQGLAAPPQHIPPPAHDLNSITATQAVAAPPPPTPHPQTRLGFRRELGLACKLPL
jgi:hypothetical protein